MAEAWTGSAMPRRQFAPNLRNLRNGSYLTARVAALSLEGWILTSRLPLLILSKNRRKAPDDGFPRATCRVAQE